MSDHISIHKAEGTWVVRAGGAVLGETTNALEVTEGSHAPAIYFPREDIAMAFLEQSDYATTSPHLGTASYFSIVTKSTTLENAAWSYEAPKDDAARIRDYLSFYVSDTVTVERV